MAKNKTTNGRTPPPNTVKVRVAVETNKDGFACVYWVGAREEIDVPTDPGNRITYVTFYAYLPEPAAEVVGEVEHNANHKETT